MSRAILLAGGKGERLDPLTREMPKVMIPFRGKPLIEQSIYNYWKHDIWELWLSVTSNKVNQITDKYPFPVLFESSPIGTGGWLKLIKMDEGLTKTFKEGDFYVNNADNLLRVDLKEMIKQHKRQKNIVTIACVKLDDVREYGSVNIRNGRITRFKEKPQSPKPKKGYISTGWYVISPKIFDYVDMTKEKISLEKDVFPKIANMNKIGAFIVEQEKDKPLQWFDVGTFERYKKAMDEWEGV